VQNFASIFDTSHIWWFRNGAKYRKSYTPHWISDDWPFLGLRHFVPTPHLILQGVKYVEICTLRMHSNSETKQRTWHLMQNMGASTRTWYLLPKFDVVRSPISDKLGRPCNLCLKNVLNLPGLTVAPRKKYTRDRILGWASYHSPIFTWDENVRKFTWSITWPLIVRFRSNQVHSSITWHLMYSFKVKCQRSRSQRDNVVRSPNYCSVLGNRVAESNGDIRILIGSSQ